MRGRLLLLVFDVEAKVTRLDLVSSLWKNAVLSVYKRYGVGNKDILVVAENYGGNVTISIFDWFDNWVKVIDLGEVEASNEADIDNIADTIAQILVEELPFCKQHSVPILHLGDAIVIFRDYDPHLGEPVDLVVGKIWSANDVHDVAKKIASALHINDVELAAIMLNLERAGKDEARPASSESVSW